MKRIVAGVLAAVVLGISISVSGPSAAIGAEEAVLPAGDSAGSVPAQESSLLDGYTLMAQQNGLELYVDQEECQLAVRNTQTNFFWRSAPEGAQDDETAQGSIRMEMQSQLVVEFADRTNQISTVNSYAACVRKETFSIRPIENGVEIQYDFAREQENFLIPVTYTLEEGGLVCRVLFSRIQERADNKIVEVRVLPYFGAAYQNTDGYLLIPDGNGGLADFQNDRSWADSYEKRIYGMDPALTNYIYRQAEETIRLPVFGICRGTDGLLAIIEEGAASGYLSAMQAGKKSSYASISAGFYYRHTDELELTAAYAKDNKVVFLSEQTTGIDPCIRYSFLTGANAGYTGMAAAYRAYLIEHTGVDRLETLNSGPTLEFLGAVRNRESFLGLMINRTRPVTTLDIVETVLGQLKDQGVGQIQSVLYYYGKKGTGASVPLSPSIDSSLGSLQRLKEIQSSQAAIGNSLYVALDYVHIASESWGIWKFNAASKSLLKSNMVRYVYKPSTLQEDKEQVLSFYLRPYRIADSVRRYVDKAESLGGAGICLSGMGTVVYTDFNNGTYSSRTETVAAYKNAFDGQEKDVPMMADGANAYLIGCADSLTGVPLSCSGDIFTQGVPFYQMVLHGIVPMSAEPLNRVSDMRRDLLRCLLTGTAFNFQLTGIPCEELSETVLQTAYNGYYTEWVPDIAAWSQAYMAVHNEIGTAYLTGYQVADGMETAVYEGGMSITANLSANAGQTEDGIWLEPGEYTVRLPGKAPSVESTFAEI